MPMRHLRFILPAVILLLLAACRTASTAVTIFADGQIYELQTAQRIPARLLEQAGITLGSADRLLALGTRVPLESEVLGDEHITLVVRRAVTLTVLTPQDEPLQILTSAETVGQALREAGLELSAADRFDPPLETPLLADMAVDWTPALDLTVLVDDSRVAIRSSAPTVGEALAEAGLALIGLDYSLPAADEPLPADGEIRLVRVQESVALSLKSIPYGTRTELTAELEIDQQALIQGGLPGLAVTRLRTRTEDGVQITQVSESESLIRPPQDQIYGFGTRIVIRTAEVDGETIEYWRALTLFSTYYIPCDPITGICHYGTSIGTLVRRGSVAFVYPWFLLFAHERLYIPGYGYGIVEDTNGAMTNAFGDTYWIDLGYAQDDVVDWVNQYVTVYFLTPVPANVADTYILP